MLLTFLVVGLLGLLMLFLSGGEDDLHDGGHDGPAIISMFNLSWFFMGFGAFGSGAYYQGLSVLLSSAVALGGGVALTGLAFRMLRLLHRQAGDSTMTPERIIGCIGVVTIPADGYGSMGKGHFLVGRESTDLLIQSKAGKALRIGTPVVVVADSGGLYLVEERTRA